MRVAPPGPRARRLIADLARVEAPGLAGATGDDTIAPPADACGANVVDVDGNLYVDWIGGFGVAFSGHRPPEVIRAARRQSERLQHALADAAGHRLRLDLARRLLDIAPFAGDDDACVYWAISGSDAVDLALKAAWLYTGRAGVLAFDPAYHGLGLGAVAVTSRPAFRRPFEPLLAADRVVRLPWGAGAGDLQRTLARHRPGAVIVEPVVGREGIRRPPVGWLATLAQAAGEHGAVLIADEVLTGGGRTGRWFAVEHDGVAPDLVCCGKVLAGGLPLAAVVGRRQVMAALDTGEEAVHTSTFLAHPPACAAAVANLKRIARLDLLARAVALGERLEGWAAGLSPPARLSGRGALYGLHLGSTGAASAFAREARRRGFLVIASGRVVQLTPPATITAAQLAASLEAFAEIHAGLQRK